MGTMFLKSAAYTASRTMTAMDAAKRKMPDGQRDEKNKLPAKSDDPPDKGENRDRDSGTEDSGKKKPGKRASGKEKAGKKNSGKKKFRRKKPGNRDSGQTSPDGTDRAEPSSAPMGGAEETPPGDSVIRTSRKEAGDSGEKQRYGAALSAMGRQGLQNAVVWAEILGPPVAKRNRQKRMERLHGDRSNAGRG